MRIKLLLSLLVAVLLSSCSTLLNTSIRYSNKNKNENKNQFKVNKIKEKKSVYLIYAKRRDSTFCIMSSKTNYPFDQESLAIKVGHYYDLSLNDNNLPTASPLHVIGLSLGDDEDDFIEYTKKCHWKIYTAKNLCSLSLVGINEKEKDSRIISIGHKVSVSVDTLSLSMGLSTLFLENITNTDTKELVLCVSKIPLKNIGQENLIDRVFFSSVGDFALYQRMYEDIAFYGYVTDEYTYPFVVKILRPEESFSILLINPDKQSSLSNHIFCLSKFDLENYLERTLEDSFIHNKPMLLYYIDNEAE